MLVSKILLSSYTYKWENEILKSQLLIIIGSPGMLTHDYITDDLRTRVTCTVNTLHKGISIVYLCNEMK